MSETESLKVYELAKELGTDSISLLDQIKALSIDVKNHMSAISSEDAHKVRASFKPAPSSKDNADTKKAAPKKTVVKKTVTRKAVAVPATTATAPTPTAATAPVKKLVRKKPAPTLTADDSATSANASTSSTVIRRRTLADGATQTVTSTISSTTSLAQEQAEAASPASAPIVHQEEIPHTSTAPTHELPTHEPKETPDLTRLSTHADPHHDGTVETVRTEVKTEGGKTTTSVIRRTETTTITQPGEPKKSLLRVIDGVEPAKSGLRTISMPEKSTVKKGFGTTTKDSGATSTDPKKPGSFKYMRVDKENLDRMAEEEAKKRGPRGADVVIKPEDVNFADYRKKELVFVPKKRKMITGKEVKKTEITVAAAHKRVVEMGSDTITVSELANQLKVKAADVIKKLMGLGQMATMNQALDVDTATLIANEYQYEVKITAFKEDSILATTEDSPEDLTHRPPVVTIMGHVDHGKTTLLDSIREANVASGEAGGITQHIGAYTIEKNGKLITFIDTPGHEAFTMMRARGANVTDIVILVVSADDGVMPQTREALSHAKAAGVPIIVAVNKIDKPGANPEKIKQSLAELDLLAEDWGGETIYVPVSALKKTNIDKLLESILLVAEVQDLKANSKVAAEGIVLEARLEKGRGPVASLLIKRGTLRQGDMVVSGTTWGKAKAMMNHLREPVKEVSPGMAVEILGLDSVPNAGEPFNVVADERAASTLIDYRKQQIRDQQQKSSKASLEDLFAKVAAGDTKELKVIVKADVFGSTEAVRDSLIKLSTDKVKVKVILAAAGGITESDVMLANASHAIIVGFNVRPETKARQLAESEKIQIKTYNIIYELLDDVKNAMTGLLDKKKVETYLGRAEVRQTFTVPKAGTIAGCAVVDGKINRNASVRLLRDSKIIFDGRLSSLKRFKDDTKEVAQGYECGMGIDGYNDIKIGDLIEAYQVDLIAQEL